MENNLKIMLKIYMLSLHIRNEIKTDLPLVHGRFSRTIIHGEKVGKIKIFRYGLPEVFLCKWQKANGLSQTIEKGIRIECPYSWLL